MAGLKLHIIDRRFTIHKLDQQDPIPITITKSPVYWLARTEDELSIVCESSIDVPGSEKNEGWSCIKISGPLAFDLTGILSGIALVLASASISIFALSTFNTDYILVKSGQLEMARKVLTDKNYHFE